MPILVHFQVLIFIFNIGQFSVPNDNYQKGIYKMSNVCNPLEAPVNKSEALSLGMSLSCSYLLSYVEMTISVNLRSLTKLAAKAP
jgi:hypothetical protein